MDLIAMKLLDKPTSRNQSYINYCTFMPPYKAAFFAQHVLFSRNAGFHRLLLLPNKKSKPTRGLPNLFRIFNLSDIPHRNLQHVFAQLAGLWAAADHRAHAALLFGNFVQHLKRAGHVGVYAGRLFDLDGIQHAILLDDEVDFAFHLNGFAVFLRSGLVLASIVRDEITVVQPGVGEGLQDL